MIRMRVQYMKTGAIRYTSHLDTVRMFQRGFKACGMPVSYSQGYHPHPRMSFGPSLKTGWEGYDEYFDSYLDFAVEHVAERCNPHLPDGLRITGSAIVPAPLPKLPVAISGARFVVRVPDPGPNAAEDADIPGAAIGERAAGPAPAGDALLSLFDSASAPVSASEPKLLDVALSREDEFLSLEYTCTMRDGKYLSPEIIAREALARPEMNGRSLRVMRTRLFVGNHNDFVSPLDEGERLETSGKN